MIGPQNSTLRCLGFWPQFCNVFGTATIGSGRWCRGGGNPKPNCRSRKLYFALLAVSISTADEEERRMGVQTIRSKVEFLHEKLTTCQGKCIV